MRVSLWSIIKVVITIALLYLIFREINLQRLINEFYRIKIQFLLLAMLTYFFLNITITARLYYILKKFGKKISFGSLLFKQFFGMLASDFSPGRAGYLALTLPLMKEVKISLEEGTSLLLTIQAIEFLFKSSVSILGIIYLSKFLSSFALEIFIGLFALIAMGLGFLILMWKEAKLLNKILLKIPFGNKIIEKLKLFKETSRKLKDHILFILIFCFFGWTLRGIEWYFLSRAANMPLSFIAALALQPLLTTIRFIPITISGLGAYEGAIIIIFSFFGIPAENVLLFSFLDRIDNTLVDLIGLKEVKKL